MAAELYPTDMFVDEPDERGGPLRRSVEFIDGHDFQNSGLTPSRNASAGWCVERQRAFLEVLAETGSVHSAAAAARLTARSAYRLRARSPAFAQAWNTAQQLAVGRLSALAFDRAIHGRLEQRYEGGVLVAERRTPSDRMLMWLLSRLDPARFALPWERRSGEEADPQAQALTAFPDELDALQDLTTTRHQHAPEPAKEPQPPATETLATPQAPTPTPKSAGPRTWGCHVLPPLVAVTPPSLRPLGPFAGPRLLPLDGLDRNPNSE
jgi:hypothetical protein